MHIKQITDWKFYDKITRFWALDYYRIIHSIKTAIACLIGLGIEKYFNWPMGQWIPITIIVVMSAQAHFGAALQKAYMRFLGTVAGVVTTIITLLIFGDNYFAIFPIIFISCLFFTYIASSGSNISYAGTLGGVTVVLTLTSINANIQQTITRGIYIVLGIIIALLVSRFIFPIHAREKLRLSVANALRDLHKFYLKTIQIDFRENQQPATSEVEDKLGKGIVDNLAEQPKLIEEAAVGSRYFNNYKKDLYAEVVGIERKVYRLIYFMHRSISEKTDLQKVMHKIGSLEDIHIVIENSLRTLADNVENFTMPPKHAFSFDNLIAKITQATNLLPKERDAQKVLDEHSFLFFMEQLIKEIRDLYGLFYKINFPGKKTIEM